MHPLLGGKTYGASTVGVRGQLVIPSELRKILKIKSGDQLMVFAKTDGEERAVILVPSGDFSKFLEKAAAAISRLESKVPKKD